MNKQSLLNLELSTDRLVLRTITLEDKGFILKLVNTEGWLKFIGDRAVHNAQDAAIYIQKILERKGCFYGVFEDKITRVPMGIVTFLLRDTQTYPDLGFAILPDYEGFGFAMEASKVLLNHLFSDNPSLHNVIAITKKDNTKSIHLIKKLGFEYQSQDSQDNDLSIYIISNFNHSRKKNVN